MWQSWGGCLQYIWLFSHFQFWRPEFKVRVSAGLVPSEGCEGEYVPGVSPRLIDAVFLFMWGSPYLCACVLCQDPISK